MREYRIFYFILYLISAITVLVYQSGLTLIIFITMTLLSLLSFSILLISSLCVKIQIRCKETVLRKKERSKIEIEITNRFLLPLPALRLYGVFQNNDELKPLEKVLLIFVPAFGSIKFDLPVSFRYRGQYKVGSTFFELRDMLGIWCFKKQIGCIFNFIVIPRDMNVLKAGEVNEDDTSTTSRVIGSFNNSVFSSLREYRSGDTLKQIHWKLSAKQDELISKELEQPLNHSAVIFADFTFDYPNEHTAMAITDAIIETMLSINKVIITENNSIKNFWQDVRTEKCESLDVSNVEHYSRLLYTLSLLPESSYPDPFSELVNLFLKEAGTDKSVYFILPKITENFIEIYKHAGFLTRKNITVITFSGGFGPASVLNETSSEHYEYMCDKTSAKVLLLNPESLSDEQKK